MFVRIIVPISVYNFVILAKIIIEKFPPKPSEGAVLTVFFSLTSDRPELDTEVISDVLL